jgi:hypothetical protein
MATIDDVMAKLELIHDDVKKGLVLQAELQAAATGSWQWDKKSGILKMYNAEGTEIAVFSVSDSPDKATRERRVDLES